MRRLNLLNAVRVLSKNNVDYGKLITHQFPLEVLEQYADKLEGHWWRVSKYQKLTEDFIRKFSEKLNWEMLSQYQILSEEFICEFQQTVNWVLISKHQSLSEKFICNFSNKVDWNKVSQYQKLSEDFIIKWKEKVDWKLVSEHQRLSIDFMNDFFDKIEKKIISSNQKLDEKFVIKHIDNIDSFSIADIFQNVPLSISTIEILMRKVNRYVHEYAKKCFSNIVTYQKVSQHFCVKYSNVLPLHELRFNKLISNEEQEQILTTVGILNKLA